MAIPDYQSIMLPLLRLLSDNKEHTQMAKDLAEVFNLTEDDMKVLLPNTKVKRFSHRVGWATTYLKKAGLVDYPKRGVTRITARGMDVLSQNPEKIDRKFLKQFTEFLEFIAPSNAKSEGKDTEAEAVMEAEIVTPDESLDKNYYRIKRGLADELLSRVKNIQPEFFERLVVELLVKMGYGGSREYAGRAVGRSGDGGIDGIINEDRLGLDVIYLQAKRWDGVVGRPEIQKFVGALSGQRAKKGVFITTSKFTKEAMDYVKHIDSKIVLIDGEQLADLMIDYNIGVTIKNTYEIKKIDSDYFEEE